MLTKLRDKKLAEIAVGCIVIAWGFSQLVELAGSKFAG